MTLNRYKLGQLIEWSDERNENLKYGLENVKGISIKKEFIETKADMNGVSLKPYKIVKNDYFAYVPITSRNGEKITLAHNVTEETYIVSSSYIVFKVIKPEIIDSDYLFMYFNRYEFDRYSRFNSWGSAREAFSWQEMCDIELELPDIGIQRKYAALYKAMLENQKNYEKGLEDLKLTCFSIIEKLRKEMELYPIGKFIETYNEKNIDGKITLEQGINVQKEFITPQRSNSNLKGRKIVRKGQFAYCTQLNNENVAIAYRKDEDCIVSSVYDVFEIKYKDKLLPEYLMLWLSRKEFGRYVYWASEGSAYEFLNYDNISSYLIPVPSIDIQKNISNIYNTYILRKEINEKLKEQIKNICPILIKGSLEEAKSN